MLQYKGKMLCRSGISPAFAAAAILPDLSFTALRALRIFCASPGLRMLQARRRRMRTSRTPAADRTAPDTDRTAPDAGRPGTGLSAGPLKHFAI